MIHVSRSEWKRMKAMAEARKAKREEKRPSLPWGLRAAKPVEAGGSKISNRRPTTPNRLNRKPGAKKRKNKKLPRRLAFDRLENACRTFVLRRNAALRNGMCEIAMSCGGENHANTWYHGWPQKGGNGLKYDVRSHFASCGPCNMGEYGSRMAGSPLYINRHKELLGEALWAELNALHGRRQISTAEARAMTEALENRIKNGEWL